MDNHLPRHFILLLILTTGILLFQSPLRFFIHLLAKTQNYLAHLLIPVFAPGNIGNFIRLDASVIMIPLVLGTLLTLIYWFLRRRHFPYLSHLIWGLWFALITTLITTH